MVCLATFFDNIGDDGLLKKTYISTWVNEGGSCDNGKQCELLDGRESGV